MVQIRLSSKAIAQILLCYEIGPSGFGTRRNNQYHIVGTEGSIFWDLDRVELWTGDREREVWELPSWTLPDFKPRDPRRIGNTARQLDDFIAALRDGRTPAITRRGRPGGDRDDPGGEAIGPDRAGRGPAAARRAPPDRWPTAGRGPRR